MKLRSWLDGSPTMCDTCGPGHRASISRETPSCTATSQPVLRRHPSNSARKTSASLTRWPSMLFLTSRKPNLTSPKAPTDVAYRHGLPVQNKVSLPSKRFQDETGLSVASHVPPQRGAWCNQHVQGRDIRIYSHFPHMKFSSGTWR